MPAFPEYISFLAWTAYAAVVFAAAVPLSWSWHTVGERWRARRRPAHAYRSQAFVARRRRNQVSVWQLREQLTQEVVR